MPDAGFDLPVTLQAPTCVSCPGTNQDFLEPNSVGVVPLSDGTFVAAWAAYDLTYPSGYCTSASQWTEVLAGARSTLTGWTSVGITGFSEALVTGVPPAPTLTAWGAGGTTVVAAWATVADAGTRLGTQPVVTTLLATDMTWETPQLLDQGGGYGYPSVALNAAGTGIVTWSGSPLVDAGPFQTVDEFAAPLSPTVGTAVDLSVACALPTGNVASGTAAVDPTGNGAVIWSNSVSNFAVTYSPSSGWSPCVELTNYGGYSSANWPIVADIGAGEFGTLYVASPPSGTLFFTAGQP